LVRVPEETSDSGRIVNAGVSFDESICSGIDSPMLKVFLVVAGEIPGLSIISGLCDRGMKLMSNTFMASSAAAGPVRGPPR
jgi:hypothetical protein